MTLGEKLKEARKQADLSQEQLAEQLHISRSAIAKWEAGLGIPDVENLKALSQLLNLSLDDLLDDTQTLEDARSNQAESNDTCCGKSCEGCTHQEALNCPGCRKLDHHGIDGCAIARCCQGKRLDSCKDCGYRETCNMLRSRDYTPEKRLTALNHHKAQKQAALDRRAAHITWWANAYPTLLKWMPLLFWVYLLPMAANLLGLLPAIVKPVSVLTALLPAAYAFLLLKLSPIHSNYKPASYFYLAAAAVSVITVFCPDAREIAAALQDAISNTGDAVITPGSLHPNNEQIVQLMKDYDNAKFIGSVLDFISSVLLLGAAFFEYHAHTEVLAPICKEQSLEWAKLWKLEFLFTGGLLASLLGMLLLPFLSSILALLLLVFSIGNIVVTVKHWIALFHLSKYFRTTTAQDMLHALDTDVPLP